MYRILRFNKNIINDMKGFFIDLINYEILFGYTVIIA